MTTSAEDSESDERIVIDENTEEVDLVRQRLTDLGDLSFLKSAKVLNLRWNRLTKIQGLNIPTLTELILYDNQIKKIENLDLLVNLKYLDLSYNRIEKMENLDGLEKLEKLYVCRNKISKIEGLENLKNLKVLEFGDNRIERIENLESLINLEELHLGANQIKIIENLECLSSTLKLLDLPANAITKIKGLETLKNLETLSIAQNGVSKIENLDLLQNLRVLDLNDNIIKELEGLKNLKKLNRLWIRKIKNLTPAKLVAELSMLSSLEHLVIEGTELSKEKDYRQQIFEVLPNLQQLDSYPIWWKSGDPWQLAPDGFFGDRKKET
uniref:Protein phosphatase 1 regulatory subunit 7 n=1 Tax=Panagrolaimus sp. ES5 TaxID=591445 RepID=A0AC34F4C7_9BILA